MSSNQEVENLYVDGRPITTRREFEIDIINQRRSLETYRCSLRQNGTDVSSLVEIHAINREVVIGAPVVFSSISEPRPDGSFDFTPNHINTDEKIAIIEPPDNFHVLGVLRAVRLRP